MKAPRRINDILKKRQELIDAGRIKLEKTVIKLQSNFLNEVIGDLIGKLQFDEYGNLKDIKSNYRVLGDFNKIFNNFQKIQQLAVIPQIVNTTYGLVELGKNYFALALTEDLGKRFDKVIEMTASKINLRVGLEGGKMVRGGFLESFMKDQVVGTQVKNYVAKSVVSQIDRKDFIQGLTKIVNGDKGPGALEKQYQRFAYDIYQQYDAAYNLSLADELREFCIEHNAKVWSREEADEWINWIDSKGNKPSYLGYPGYSPLIDRGGYNCRHMIDWISDELAFRMRPELRPLKEEN
jgi:hypothetical protein